MRWFRNRLWSGVNAYLNTPQKARSVPFPADSDFDIAPEWPELLSAQLVDEYEL